MSDVSVQVRVNGVARAATVPARLTLADYLRERCGLTGTHLGCEHGVCGACTVLLDGEAVRACLMFAVQADGCEVTTVEGLHGSHPNGFTAVQEGFRQCHGLQCGYCTPGMVMAVTGLLREHPTPTDDEIRAGLEGNICRCTGYHNIVKAVLQCAAEQNGGTERLSSETVAGGVA